MLIYDFNSLFDKSAQGISGHQNVWNFFEFSFVFTSTLHAFIERITELMNNRVHILVEVYEAEEV